MRQISDSKQKKFGIILSYASEAVGIIVGLIYTPIMIRTLGQNEYGLYQLVSSVVSYLSLIGLGFSSSYQRYYAKTKDDGDADDMAKLNGMFMIVFLTMSAICLVCGGILIANAKLVFAEGLTDAELSKAKLLMVYMIINMAITFPNSLFTSNIIAHKQFIFQKSILLIHQILNPLICLPVLLMGYGSVGMVAVALALSFASMIANAWFSFAQLHIKISIKRLNFLLFKDIWGFTFFIFLNQIVNQVNWSVDKFLLGRFCGTAAVAVYSIGGQLRSYFSQFSSAISNVFIPEVNEIVAESDDNKKLDSVFIKVGRLQAYVIFLIFTGFIFFGKNFVCLWAGEQYEESYTIALMLFAVLTVPYIQNLGIEIQRAKNKHRIRSIVYAVMAVLNIVLSIPLIKLYGAVGAALGTVISLFLCAIVFMNLYYSRYIGLDIKAFWKSIAKMLPGLILPVGVGMVLYMFLNQRTWCNLFMCIVIYTTVYVISMYKFAMTDYEKNSIRRIIKKIRGK